MKNKNLLIWKIIRILSVLPFLYVICIGLYYALNPAGIEFFMDAKIYGFQAFVAIVILYTAVFWYIGIICLFLFIFSCIYCRKLKHN